MSQMQAVLQLPQVIGVDRADTREGRSQLSDYLRYVVKILRVCEEAGGVPFLVKRYKLLNDGLADEALEIVPVDEKAFPVVRVRVEDKAQVQQEFRQLGAVLADLRKRGEDVREVDLRFVRQIIVDLTNQN